MGGINFQNPSSLGGSAAVSNPGVAYVRTGGDDETAQVGNPAKPFATGTAAFESGARSFDFGVGLFDLITDGGSFAMHVRGCGIQHTTVNITHNGQNGERGEDGSNGGSDESGTNGTDGSSGSGAGPLWLSSDHSATINLLSVGGVGGDGGNGGNAGDSGEPVSGGNGGNGGNGGSRSQITMSAVTGTADIRSGPGGSGGGGGAGSSPGSNGAVGFQGEEVAYGEARFCFLSGPNKAFRALGTVFDNVWYDDY